MQTSLKSAIVRILKPDGHSTAGTGFVVDYSGPDDPVLIVTCYHVVESALISAGEPYVLFKFLAVEEAERDAASREAEQAHAELAAGPPPHVDKVVPGPPLKASINRKKSRATNKQDVALLEYDALLPAGVQKLRFTDRDIPEGHELSTYGFPDVKAVSGLPGEGHVTGDTREGLFRVVVLSSKEITYGFSGAPVWDAQLGAVVGIVVSVAAQPDNEYPQLDPAWLRLQTAFYIPGRTFLPIFGFLPEVEESPYRGLAFFDEEHAGFYFGREFESAELVRLLRQHDIVAVVGMSGSGKSSLVRAGLRKAMDVCRDPVIAERKRCIFEAGSAPLLSLLLALADNDRFIPSHKLELAFGADKGLLTQPAVATISAGHATDDEILDKRGTLQSKLLAMRSEDIAAKLHQLLPQNRIILVLDQFERLYTEGADDVRQHFIGCISSLARLGAKVVIAFRADFYAQVLGERLIGQSLEKRQVSLSTIDGNQLEAAITLPAQQYYRFFQPDLVTRLIMDIAGHAERLPFLQFTLRALWEQESASGLLTTSTYLKLGYQLDGAWITGLQATLIAQAEHIWQSMAEDERKKAAATRVFLSLVTPHGSLSSPTAEGGTGERLLLTASRRALQSEYDEYTQAVARELADSFLVTTGVDPLTNGPTVQIAHEVLLKSWTTLTNLIQEYRDYIVWYSRDFAPEFNTWQEKDSHDDFLLPSTLLVEAEKWLARYPELLRGPASSYIRASRAKIAAAEQQRQEAEAAAEQQRQETEAARQRVRHIIFRSSIVATVLLLMVTAVAVWEASKAKANLLTGTYLLAKSNLASRQLSSTAMLLADFLRQKGSRKSSEINDARECLLDALVNGLQFVDHRKLPDKIGEDQPITAIGSDAFVTGADGQVKIINLKDNSVTSPIGAKLPTISSIAYDSAHRILAFGEKIAGRDKASGYIVSLLSQGHLFELPGEYSDTVSAVAFSKDGKWLATSSSGNDGSAYIWRTTLTQRRDQPVFQLEGGISSLSLSGDGRLIVAGGWNNKVVVWHSDGTGVTQLGSHESSVTSVAIDPGATIAASASHDGQVILWNIREQLKIAAISIPNERARTPRNVAFSDDGRNLTVVCSDRSVFRWKFGLTPEVKTLYGHALPVRGVAITGNGTLVASCSDDRTVRLWNVSSGTDVTAEKMRGINDPHHDAVESVAISKDGRWVVSGDNDSAFHIVDLVRKKAIPFSHSSDSAIDGVAVDPNGRYAALGSNAGVVRLYSLNPVTELNHKALGTGAIYQVTFSPNGRELLGASQDKYIHRFSLPDMSELTPIKTKASLWDAVYTPDGKQIIAGDASNHVTLWDPVSGKLLCDFDQGTSVTCVDSTVVDGDLWIASTVEDGTIKLWSVGAKKLLYTLRGHLAYVYPDAFSSNGQWLVSGGIDGTVRLWNMPALRAFFTKSPSELLERIESETHMQVHGTEVSYSSAF